MARRPRSASSSAGATALAVVAQDAIASSMGLDGYASGREIVAALRDRFAPCEPAQRLRIIENHLRVLEHCPRPAMRLDPITLLAPWRALWQAYCAAYERVRLDGHLTPAQARELLKQAVQHELIAARQFEEAGALLMADVLAPDHVIREYALHSRLPAASTV